MPVFTYMAANPTGGTVKGKLTALNELDLEERLQDLGLTVMSYKAMKQKNSIFFGKVSIKELIMFCVHLEQLDKAGVPLLDSLADMRDSADSPTFRDVVADIYESVKSGEMLSVALNKRPDIFGEVFVGLVQAGEGTGQLSSAFGHLATHLKWTSNFRRSIKKALMYPIALIVVMSSVITLMMLFVVPKLVEFLSSQGFELPVHTRALIATSAFFEDYWYLVLGLPVLTVIGIILLYKASDAARYRIDSIMLSTPFIGNVILKINLARFTRFFSITFNSGIGVLDCLKTARNVVGNSVMKESISFIIQNISEGNSITRAIAATQKFPSLVVRMFKVGEDSGNMEDALQNINFFYDREVDDSVAAMVGIIQPTLTIVMGMMMFWIIAAVFGPLYDSFQNIQ